jgi:NADP-dependent 3-hydroxy acid dehydrogenase YdfG
MESIALVTGGASGIGHGDLPGAGRRGSAYVYIADLNLDGAEALAAELGSATALQMDVTQPASIATALEKSPQLDILVNNAGIGHVGDILRTELEDCRGCSM